MNADMYKEAKDVFNRAVELSGIEREELLRQECGDNRSLRCAVEQLLDNDRKAGSFLRTPLRPFGCPPMGNGAAQCTRECPTCGQCFDGSEPTCPLDGARLEFTMEGTSIIDGKYRLLRRIGMGGMGRVYRAHHLGLDRDCAIKLIRPALLYSQEFEGLFLQETKAVGLLDHDNIIRVTDSGVDPRGTGLPYLVMELLIGETLREYIDRMAPVEVDDALNILDGVAAGLDYAHKSSVCHHDLTPSNVYLNARAPRIRIMDFGLSRIVGMDLPQYSVASSESTADESNANDGLGCECDCGNRLSSNNYEPNAVPPLLPGTVAYMAPERLNGACHNSGSDVYKSDIYALGVIACELLTKNVPFGREAEKVLILQRSVPAPLLSVRYCKTPPELDEPIQRFLDINPSARPETAGLGVASLRSAWWAAQQRIWREKEVPRRIALSFTLAFLLTIFLALGNRVGLFDGIELKPATWWFAIQHPKEPDPRVVLVSFDDQSQIPGTPALSEREDDFIRYVDGMFASGARAVAVDLIMPERWGESEAFSRLVLRHADRLILALYSHPSGQTTEGQCLNALTIAALGPARYSQLFGFVNQTEDADGLVHRSPLFYRDTEGILRDTWATKASRPFMNSALFISPDEERDRFWIDYSISTDSFTRISWKDVPFRLRDRESLFRDRLVLVGAEYRGEDFHRVPKALGPPKIISGFALQALTVNTILNGASITSIGGIGFMLYTASICSLVLLSLICIPPRRWIVITFVGANISNLIITCAVFTYASTVMPFAASTAGIAIVLTIGLCLRPRLPAFPPGADR